MCMGELGRVVERHADVALVRTNHGEIAVSVLLSPDVGVGDHVVVHSGHVLSVVSADAAVHATRLRGGAESSGG